MRAGKQVVDAVRPPPSATPLRHAFRQGPFRADQPQDCALPPPAETTPELLLIDKAAGCFLRAPRAFYVSERARLRGWSGLFEGIIKYRHCRQVGLTLSFTSKLCCNLPLIVL